MVKQVEAVFEHGVFRPLEPLSLPEHQRVVITIDDRATTVPYNPRKAEMEWLDVHGNEYIGQWVALEGGTLLSHGPRAVAVRDEARSKGSERPLIVHIPEDYGLPSAGLL